MQDLYLFEAGGTKTDVQIVINGKQSETRLSGFNPNREHQTFLDELTKLNINEAAKVIFYGAGLSSDTNKRYVGGLFQTKEIEVYDDMIGAARALFGRQQGVLALMGTGGLAAFYNGEDIIGRRGGYGFLIDDLGGGLELGKAILSAWLNGDLSESSNKALQISLNGEGPELVKQIYANNDLALIATVPILVKDVKDDALEGLIYDYFDLFIKRNIKPLCLEHQQDAFSIVGSVGEAFQGQISSISTTYGLEIGRCVKSPSSHLLAFHLGE